VAFEARAEDRESRAFISARGQKEKRFGQEELQQETRIFCIPMTMYSRLTGLRAYWTLHLKEKGRSKDGQSQIMKLTQYREGHHLLSDDSDVSNDLDGSRPEHVVLIVREGLGRSDDDRISGVRAERVEVLHVAADDSVLSR
jgi:hypothetical protein